MFEVFDIYTGETEKVFDYEWEAWKWINEQIDANDWDVREDFYGIEDEDFGEW